MIKKILHITILLLSISVSAQVDSLNITVPLDSISAVADSLALSDSLKKKDDIDAVVFASSSDSLQFSVKEKKMYIYGEGNIKYKDTDLSSGEIKIDFNTNDLEAKGLTEITDSAGKQLIQTPKLSEASELYEGSEIKYNFKTRRGFISLAKNKGEGKSYGGTKVKKVDADSYFVEDGIYTTCDAENPHTHFAAKRMKVINKEQIIVQWGIMYIAGVPIPIPIPFGVFPTKKGRHSGIIPPGYSVSGTRGQSFSNFGYYWAMNDYMDLALNADYYTQGGWGFRSNFNYKKRYSFSGYFRGGYSKDIANEEQDDDYSERTNWNFQLRHNQTIDPTSRLDVDLQYRTSDYFRKNSANYNDILDQLVTSNATYSKRFEDLGASLTLSYRRSEDFGRETVSETLPSLSFNKSQFYPFKSKSTTSRADQKWYEQIGMNYNGKFQNNRNKKDGDLKIRGGINHDLSMNASPKLGYFNISPSVSYNEKWYNKKVKMDYIEGSEGQDSLAAIDVHELNFLRTFRFSLAASTKLYGMMQTDALGIEAFRHTITPSISYNYSPDFSKDEWGYYETYIDSTGQEVSFDPYQKEIFSSVPSNEQQSVNFSVGNVFEMKTLKDPTDTTSQAQKIELLKLNLSTGYNFAAKEFKQSDLALNFSTKIGELLNISGNSSYSFYDYDSTGRKVNEYLKDANKGLLRNTNFSFNLSTSISGEKLKGKDDKKEGSEEESDEFNTFKKTQYESIYKEEEPDFSIPWDLSLSYRYSMNKSNPLQHNKGNALRLTLGLNLTENWKIRMSGGYDIKRKDVTAPNITINRDLHCWELSFNWKPLGTYRGFRFEIRMKAPELRDVKVTKSGGLYSGIR
ncbi:MAG: LPS-assembly protein LptD [Melioribacteraceae bacterium]|nr:LPS-assembly protein LptD [Melioribacteraceae bacterium]